MGGGCVMPLYAYRALTLAGETRDGEESASSIAELRESLAARDLLLRHARAARLSLSLANRKTPLAHIASFNRQFVVLLKAGISVPEALSMTASRPGHARLERALGLLLEEVRGGKALSEAARNLPYAFDPAHCAMIVTGERSGTLPQSLEQ